MREEGARATGAAPEMRNRRLAVALLLFAGALWLGSVCFVALGR